MSNEQNIKIQNFTDLDVWKYAHALYVSIYEATKTFPKEELFGLTNQIRRASLSVSSNIAEGFGRRTDADKARFYSISRGSLFEVQNQLYAARDIGILDEKSCNSLMEKSIITQRILIGLIKSTLERNSV